MGPGRQCDSNRGDSPCYAARCAAAGNRPRETLSWRHPFRRPTPNSAGPPWTEEPRPHRATPRRRPSWMRRPGGAGHDCADSPTVHTPRAASSLFPHRCFTSRYGENRRRDQRKVIVVPTVLVAHPSADVYGSDLQLLESLAGLLEAGNDVRVVLPSKGPLAERLPAGVTLQLRDVPVLRKALLRP